MSYELAGIGSRALACILDSFLQLLIVALLIWALVWLQYLLGLPDITGTILAIVLGTLTFLATVVYYVACEMAMAGQSPGKRLAGLRVVRANGTPLTFTDSAIRNILRLVDVLPGFYTVGLITVFCSRQCQRLGDMAAGTVVVKERLYEAPTTPVPDLTAAPVLPPTLPPEAVARLRNTIHLLSEADCAAAARFLERQTELNPQVRQQLALKLATPLMERLPGLTLHEFGSAEAFLEALVHLRPNRF